MSDVLSGTKQVAAVALLQSVGIDPGVVGTPPVQLQPEPPKPVPLKPRTLTWKAPADAIYVGDTIVAADLVQDSANLGNPILAEPGSALMAAAADSVAVKITAAAKDGFDKAEVTGTIAVLKRTAELSWKSPTPILINTPLGIAQLNATRDPIDLPVKYTPAAGKTFTAAGDNQLSVECTDTTRYLPVAPVTVTLTVVATPSSRAVASGKIEMQTGRAWKPMVSPADDLSISMMYKWKKDTGKLQTKGKEVMAAIKDMTADELKTYLNGKKTEVGFKDYNERLTGPNGGPSEFPNIIWRFDNGLQVRYKPNGDPRNKGQEMFCVEVRTNDDLDAQQDGVACKLMPDGTPGPKGNGSTQFPDWIDTMPDGGPKDSRKIEFMDSACSMTHLMCAPKEDQVITWLDPAEIEVGTALLGATALGNVTCTYERAGSAVIVGHKPPAGADQSIKVKAPGTDRYKPGQATFKVTVKKKSQTVVWAGPFQLTVEDELTDEHLGATCLGTAAMTYEAPDGTELTVGDVAGDVLGGGDHQVKLLVAETAEYLEDETKTATFTISKLDQEIDWDPPKGVQEGAEAKSLFTAEYLGKGEEGRDYGDIYYTIVGDSGQIEEDDPLPAGKVNVTLYLSESRWYEDADTQIEVNVAKAPKTPNKRRG